MDDQQSHRSTLIGLVMLVLTCATVHAEEKVLIVLDAYHATRVTLRAYHRWREKI